MAAFNRSSARYTRPPRLPPLRDGDRLNQETYHERYEAMPGDFRAELIEGIVYVASPQKPPHGKTTKYVILWLDDYEKHTPGVESFPGVTNILGPVSEPEPDNCLFILPEFGGQTRFDEQGYFVGPPELIVETSDSTESRDLRLKKTDYQNAGVREYIVFGLRSKRVFWFYLRAGKFTKLNSSPDGIFRSKVFPGLWLDPNALLNHDRVGLLEILHQGLQSKEHREFVLKLAKRKRTRSS